MIIGAGVVAVLGLTYLGNKILSSNENTSLTSNDNNEDTYRLGYNGGSRKHRKNKMKNKHTIIHRIRQSHH